jgi:hypothetical protein
MQQKMGQSMRVCLLPVTDCEDLGAFVVLGLVPRIPAESDQCLGELIK